jgi:hypothetical protein
MVGDVALSTPGRGRNRTFSFTKVEQGPAVKGSNRMPQRIGNGRLRVVVPFSCVHAAGRTRVRVVKISDLRPVAAKTRYR